MFKPLFFVFLLVSLSYSAMADIYPILVRPLINDSIQPNMTLSYNFSFSNNASCLPELYNSGELNITLDSTGYGMTELNISNLTTVPDYLCEYRSGSIRRVHPIPDIIGNRLLFKSLLLDNITANTGNFTYLFVNNTNVCLSDGTNCLVADSIFANDSTYIYPKPLYPQYLNISNILVENITGFLNNFTGTYSQKVIFTGQAFHYINPEGEINTVSSLWTFANTTGNRAIISGKRFGGSPVDFPNNILPAKKNSVLLDVSGRAYNGDNDTTLSIGANNSARMRFVVDENCSTTACGTRIEFYTTPSGNTSPVQVGVISNDGKLGVGNNLDNYPFGVIDSKSIYYETNDSFSNIYSRFQFSPQQNTTSTSNKNGIYSYFTVYPAENVTVSDPDHNYNGVQSIIVSNGDGKINGMSGVVVLPYFYGSSNVTNLYDFIAEAPQKPQSVGTGYLTNHYGMLIESLDSLNWTTNRYGIAQRGVNTTNYFEGKIAIGKRSADVNLDVNGSTAIANDLTVSGTTYLKSTSINGTLYVDGDGSGGFWVTNGGDFYTTGTADYLMGVDRYVWRVLGLEVLGQYLNFTTNSLELKDYLGNTIQSNNVLTGAFGIYGTSLFNGNILANNSQVVMQRQSSSSYGNANLYIQYNTSDSHKGLHYVDSSGAYVFGHVNGARMQMDSSAFKYLGNYPVQYAKQGTSSSPAQIWQDDGATGPYLKGRGNYGITANMTPMAMFSAPWNNGASGGLTTIYGNLSVTGKIWSNNTLVCLADGTNCPSSVGLWTNDSTQIYPSPSVPQNLLLNGNQTINNGRLVVNSDTLSSGLTGYNSKFTGNSTWGTTIQIQDSRAYTSGRQEFIDFLDASSTASRIESINAGYSNNTLFKIYVRNNTNSLNQVVEISDGNLNVTGNITGNDCIANNRAYFQIYRTSSFDMISAGSWYDYSWNNESAMYSVGITHNKSGPNPQAITLTNGGVYRISYAVHCKEASDVATRCGVRMFDGATEIIGSHNAQNFDGGRGVLTNSFIFAKNSSAVLVMQVSTSVAGTDIVYHDGSDGDPQKWVSAQLSIDRIGVV